MKACSDVGIGVAALLLLAAFVVFMVLTQGCAYQGTGKGSLVLGYSKAVYCIEMHPASGTPDGIGSGNSAVLIDVQGLVSKGSGNSNNVVPTISVPAVGGL